MKATTLSANQYEFRTKIDLRTGSITREVDTGLPTTAVRLAVSVFEILVDGLPLGELHDNKPDELRARVLERLASLQPALLKEFEHEFQRIVARHLGER